MTVGEQFDTDTERDTTPDGRVRCMSRWNEKPPNRRDNYIDVRCTKAATKKVWSRPASPEVGEGETYLGAFCDDTKFAVGEELEDGEEVVSRVEPITATHP